MRFKLYVMRCSRKPLFEKNTQYVKSKRFFVQNMINKKCDGEVEAVRRILAFLLKRWFYVRGSHLCVAPYPKPWAKLRIIEDISKLFGKKLRKFCVEGAHLST